MQNDKPMQESTIDETAGLHQFYDITTFLSRTRHVRFLSKLDEADNISWHFKYRGHPLTLQYDIYNGISLYSEGVKDAKALNEVATLLKTKRA